MLVKYSAWSTAQDLQCPCSHSLVQNEYTIYKVESVAASTTQLVQYPMSMQSHSIEIECDCMDIGHCTNWAVDAATDSTL